jgi:hypothetical protein
MTDIRTLLASAALDLSSETAAQDGIAKVLDDAGVEYEREVRLGDGDRIDFIVAVTGIEVKIKGTPSALLRQLHRYARHDAIECLLVVTSAPRLAALPAALRGKPVKAIILTGSIF